MKIEDEQKSSIKANKTIIVISYTKKMFPLRIEHRTFRALTWLSGCDNHYTTEINDITVGLK